MAKGDIRIIREVVADHDGWEDEVAAMDRDVAYLLRGLERELTRYEFHHPRENRILRVGYESDSPAVLKRVVKAGS